MSPSDEEEVDDANNNGGALQRTDTLTHMDSSRIAEMLAEAPRGASSRAAPELASMGPPQAPSSVGTGKQGPGADTATKCRGLEKDRDKTKDKEKDDRDRRKDKERDRESQGIEKERSRGKERDTVKDREKRKKRARSASSDAVSGGRRSPSLGRRDVKAPTQRTKPKECSSDGSSSPSRDKKGRRRRKVRSEDL